VQLNQLHDSLQLLPYGFTALSVLEGEAKFVQRIVQDAVLIIDDLYSGYASLVPHESGHMSLR
jgi:hypothetical protein